MAVWWAYGLPVPLVCLLLRRSTIISSAARCQDWFNRSDIDALEGRKGVWKNRQDVSCGLNTEVNYCFGVVKKYEIKTVNSLFSSKDYTFALAL